MNGVWVSVKRNYGQLAIYPANPTAAGLAQIAGKKTLSARDLAIAEAMGFGLAMEGVSEDLKEVRGQIRAQRINPECLGAARSGNCCGCQTFPAVLQQARPGVWRCAACIAKEAA